MRWLIVPLLLVLIVLTPLGCLLMPLLPLLIFGAWFGAMAAAVYGLVCVVRLKRWEVRVVSGLSILLNLGIVAIPFLWPDLVPFFGPRNR